MGDAGGNISLLHAAIAFEDDAYWLVDAGSAFGTTVNGERVKRLQLRSGDTLQFGGQGGPEARVALDMSQVMASYNRGEEGVRRALRQVAQEPGGFRKEKRDFWHLYTLKKLPPETREYVPKILAAAVVCRHPDRYGLASPGSSAGDSGMALR